MCAIFGVLDYRGALEASQRLHMVRELGRAAEVRGTDAAGIAFFQRDRLCIQKGPKPAHRMRFRIPADARYIMGHTRMTTQGNASKNQNNHPFPGKAGKTKFALAHNGVLTNDWELHISENLPLTSVETDSFAAVQLIEKQGEVSFQSLQRMAELLLGSFTFTILDQENNLYFVKGNNPLTIYHFPKLGFYLYASTTEILDMALRKLGPDWVKPVVIQPVQGKILRIDHQGNRSSSTFNTSNIEQEWELWGGYDPWSRRPSVPDPTGRENYLQALKKLASCYGYEEEYIEFLLKDGYTTDDVEHLIYYGAV